MMLLCAALLACTAFAALYLAMSRHQPDALGRRLETRTTHALRWCGWLGLGLAWMAAVQASGWARGSVIIVGMLAFAAVAVALTATWHVRRLPQLGWLALAGATTCAVLAGWR